MVTLACCRSTRSSTDSVGWPCLRFANSKIGSEQLIPLSAKAADTIRAQQAHVRERWPDGSPWLFPGIMDNPDGTRPYAHGTLSRPAGPLAEEDRLHDEAGQPVRIHAHQFRHTFGTRLINSGRAPTRRAASCSAMPVPA